MTQRRPGLRADRPSPTEERPPDPLAQIGPYAITTSLLRDADGEVCAATGPSGEVRIRLVAASVERRLARLERAAEVAHPALAPLLERLPAGDQVALVGPPDRRTLADRRRRGRLDPAAAVATGATLLEGLAALHGAGIAHGAVGATLVGIDSSGHPRWRDAGVRDGEPAADVVRFARTALDAGGLPAALAAALDEVATGTAAPPPALALLATWRDLGAAAGIPVPPPGAAVRAPSLLGPPPRRRRRVPLRLRRSVAAVAVVAAAGVWPAAWAAPGGAGPFASVAAYTPSRAGQHLEYRYERSTAAGTSTARVGVRVATAGTVAGVDTVELVPDPPPTTPSSGGAGATLPFALGGGTLRVEGDALERAADGGTVRDLQGPLRPGATWSDTRSSTAGFTTTETRSVLGPAAVTVAAGSFDRCVVVALQSVVTSAGSSSQTAAAGDAWYCAGVGLVRALLTSTLSESDAIELTAST